MSRYVARRYCKAQVACEEGTTVRPASKFDDCPACRSAAAKRGREIPPRGANTKLTKAEGRAR